ncbi:MAG: hypothetical protein LBI69_00895 [Puniceicoccales bacterium]|jgi:hypothetical protein|nr:hypothetical protein [Puniceicoccales bacterium]
MGFLRNIFNNMCRQIDLPKDSTNPQGTQNQKSLKDNVETSPHTQSKDRKSIWKGMSKKLKSTFSHFHLPKLNSMSIFGGKGGNSKPQNAAMPKGDPSSIFQGKENLSPDSDTKKINAEKLNNIETFKILNTTTITIKGENISLEAIEGYSSDDPYAVLCNCENLKTITFVGNDINANEKQKCLENLCKHFAENEKINPENSSALNEINQLIETKAKNTKLLKTAERIEFLGDGMLKIDGSELVPFKMVDGYSHKNPYQILSICENLEEITFASDGIAIRALAGLTKTFDISDETNKEDIPETKDETEDEGITMTKEKIAEEAKKLVKLIKPMDINKTLGIHSGGLT